MLRSHMWKRIRCLVLILCAGLAQSATAGTVLDVDFSTPAIESSITIPINSTLEIAAIEIDSVSPSRDRVGLDLYYKKPGDVDPVENFYATNALGANVATMAGTLVGLSGSGLSEDNFLAGPTIGAGGGLTAGTLPTVTGWLKNVGGVAFTAAPSSTDFPNAFPVDVAKWSFTFPNLGTVHFTHCGILDNNGNPVLTNANIYHEVDTNTAFPTVCSGEVRVNVVPEPTGFLLLGLMACAACGRMWLGARQSFDAA